MKFLALLALTLLPGPIDQDEGAAARSPSELARLPFRSLAGLILVDVHVKKSDSLTFVIDSGASGAVIERSLAERLKLRMGREQHRGKESGRGELDYRMARSVPFRLGDIEFVLPYVVAAPVEGTARTMLGTTVHGILGHVFLTRYTVEVDYDRGELVVHDPKRYRYEGEGAVLPLEFDPDVANLPFAPVTIESASGEKHQVMMLVDSAGSLMATMGLGQPADVAAVIPASAPRVPVLGATGLGNSAEDTMHSSFATRLHRVRFGPYAIEKPTTSCDPNSGPRLNLFGAEVLHRFRVVFDYERERLILEPGAAFDEPTLTERSGMMLVASDEDVNLRKIAFLSPGGPAEEAGLERGDVLLTIDGRPADARSLHATRELFCELGAFELKVQRDEEVFTTVLHTRDLL